MRTQIPDYPALSNLTERNAVVEEIIRETATRHAIIDATADGLAGLSPIPGTSAVVLAGQLATQLKVLYPQMLRKIALVYGADPDDYTTKISRKFTLQEGIINALVFASENGVLEDLGNDFANDLVNEFGADFLTELIQQALGESLGGLALAQVPWIGAPAGAAVAGLLAWKLTWRVGLTASLYFQNGSSFPGGSRKATTNLVRRDFVRGNKPQDLTGCVDGMRTNVPELERNMVKHIKREVQAALRSGLTDEQVLSLLRAKGFPEDIIDLALGSGH